MKVDLRRDVNNHSDDEDVEDVEIDTKNVYIDEKSKKDGLYNYLD